MAHLYLVPSPDGADACFSFDDLPRATRAAIAHHYSAARALLHVAWFARRDGDAPRVAECMALVRHHRGWIRLARAEARDRDAALRAFNRSIRKVARLIDGVARGDSDRATVAAIRGLERMADAPEIRANADASASAYAAIHDARARLIDAREAGFIARRAARDAEIAALRARDREVARARPY